MNILADFRTHRPATLADAVSALAADGAVPLAAGTDLLPNLRRGLGQPAVLVDLTGIGGLETISILADGSLRIGAGATLEAIAEHGLVRNAWPALAEAFGGEVAVNHPGGGEHGAVEVDWHLAAADDPLLDRLAANGRSVVAASHHDAVTRLPEGSVSLAASRDYPNQAFRVGSALGVQFHPEASPELMGRWAALDGGDARTMRRSMQTHDSEVARTGRLLAQAFTGHLRAQQLAA